MKSASQALYAVILLISTPALASPVAPVNTPSNPLRDSYVKGWPETSKPLMQEEKPLGQEHIVRLGDKHRLTVAGKLTEPAAYKEKTGAWSLNIDIGARRPVACAMYGNQLPYHTLRVLLSHVINHTAKSSSQKLTAQYLSNLDVFIRNDLAVMAIDYAYLMKKKAHRQIGFIKGKVARNNQYTFACYHNGLGFRSTFAKLFDRLVDSWEATDNFPAELERQLYLVYLNDEPRGVLTYREYRNRAGQLINFSEESVITPKAGGELPTLYESTRTEWSDDSGSLLQADLTELRNGVLAKEMKLESDKTQWIATGEIDGKSARFNFENPGTLSLVGQRNNIARLMMTYPHENSMSGFLWSRLDPSRLLPFELKLLQQDTEGAAGVMQFGEKSYNTRYDKRGNALIVKEIIGSNAIVSKLVVGSGASSQ